MNPKKTPRVGDDALYIQLNDGASTVSAAVVTKVHNRVGTVVSLFVMFEQDPKPVLNVEHGSSDGQWCFRGEYGL